MVPETYNTISTSLYLSLQEHDIVLDDHSRLTIDEYLVQATKMEVRTCTEHENQPFTLGCKVCHTVVCMKGLAELDKCTNGNCVKLKLDCIGWFEY